MVNRPQEMNSFEFIAIATLRTAQLIRGCVPRVPSGHKFTTTAQLEIIAGQILKLPQPPPLPPQAPDRHGDV
jgi:DNA-directed RNA polymerase subunit K/omega